MHSAVTQSTYTTNDEAVPISQCYKSATHSSVIGSVGHVSQQPLENAQLNQL